MLLQCAYVCMCVFVCVCICVYVYYMYSCICVCKQLTPPEDITSPHLHTWILHAYYAILTRLARIGCSVNASGNPTDRQSRRQHHHGPS